MSTLLFSAASLSSNLDFVRPARAKAWCDISLLVKADPSRTAHSIASNVTNIRGFFCTYCQPAKIESTSA